MKPPILHQRAHLGARRNSQKHLRKQLLWEQRGSHETISANRPLCISSTQTIRLCEFGQDPCDHFGCQSGDPKKGQNDPWSRAARPDPEATQDDAKDAQKVEHRQAPNVEKHEKHSAGAPELKSEWKSHNENAHGRKHSTLK